MGAATEPPAASPGDAGDSIWVPQVGMQFSNEDEAYAFYNKYAGVVGFSIRKSKMWTTAGDVLAARTFVCSRQGFRQKKKGFEPKKPRPATRTGCPACMTIKITPSGRYHVTEFVPIHNHPLAHLSTARMLRSHRPRHHEEESTDGLGVPPQLDHDLRFKRVKATKKGDAGRILEYLQNMQLDNPSFFYAVQVDGDDNLTNFFWADAKSMVDYRYFGDVVYFDTMFKMSDCGRPLALFVGVNHHKQVVVFGSALLYDESTESCKWLLKIFNNVMHGKRPKTFLTDTCVEMSDAVAAVWPGTAHRICVWHVYQNALKQLNQVFEGSKSFACDFSQCIFDCEEVEEFMSVWEALIEKYDLRSNEWLDELFNDRDRWALPYRGEVFCADIESTLRKESLSNVLKKCLSPQVDILHFLELYDKVVDEQRCAELQADFNINQSTPKIPSFRMLKQAASAYTPAMFKMFQKEFEMHMDCMVYSCGEDGTTSKYKVTIEEKPIEHFVRFDSSNNTVICSCKKFEFVGIQCRHVFKVLDFRNIKELPPQYIMRRWRKDAKVATVEDSHRSAFDGNSNSSSANCCNFLYCVLSTIAARAAKTMESYAFIESKSNMLMDQVEQILQTRSFEIPHLNTISTNQLQNIGSADDSLHHEPNGEASIIGSATTGDLFNQNLV